MRNQREDRRVSAGPNTAGMVRRDDDPMGIKTMAINAIGKPITNAMAGAMEAGMAPVANAVGTGATTLGTNVAAGLSTLAPMMGPLALAGIAGKMFNWWNKGTPNVKETPRVFEGFKEFWNPYEPFATDHRDPKILAGGIEQDLKKKNTEDRRRYQLDKHLNKAFWKNYDMDVIYPASYDKYFRDMSLIVNHGADAQRAKSFGQPYLPGATAEMYSTEPPRYIPPEFKGWSQGTPNVQDKAQAAYDAVTGEGQRTMRAPMQYAGGTPSAGGMTSYYDYVKNRYLTADEMNSAMARPPILNPVDIYKDDSPRVATAPTTRLDRMKVARVLGGNYYKGTSGIEPIPVPVETMPMQMAIPSFKPGSNIDRSNFYLQRLEEEQPGYDPDNYRELFPSISPRPSYPDPEETAGMTGIPPIQLAGELMPLHQLQKRFDDLFFKYDTDPSVLPDLREMLRELNYRQGLPMEMGADMLSGYNYYPSGPSLLNYNKGTPSVPLPADPFAPVNMYKGGTHKVAGIDPQKYSRGSDNIPPMSYDDLVERNYYTPEEEFWDEQEMLLKIPPTPNPGPFIGPMSSLKQPNDGWDMEPEQLELPLPVPYTPIDPRDTMNEEGWLIGPLSDRQMKNQLHQQKMSHNEQRHRKQMMTT